MKTRREAGKGVTQEPQRMLPVAFPYKRFSSPSQQDGDSIRRQNALSVAWSERHNVSLDLTLTLEDRGVSGFHGVSRSDPDQYALAAFLKAVEIGRAQPGDYLLIENLDRLSREEEVPATHLLTSILMTGVKVVQLSPYEMELTNKSDGWTIMRAVMELSRGHGESRIKSERIRQAWTQRRAAAAAGEVPLTGRLPAWMRVGKDGLPELIPERAAVLRRIYELAGPGGRGLGQISGILTNEGVPTFTTREPVLDENGRQETTRTGRPRYRAVAGEPHGSGRWNRTYLGMILRDRRAVGELEAADGTLVRIPAAVTEQQWLAARAGRDGRQGRPGREAKQRPNLFVHLLHDALTGSSYVIHASGHHAPAPVLVTSDNQERRSPCHSFPLETFEAAILTHLSEINPAQILRQEQPDETTQLAGRLRDVQRQKKELEEELAACQTAPKAGVRVLVQLEEQEKELEKQLRTARQKAAHPLSEAWGQAQGLLTVIARDPEARIRLRALLRQLVTDIRLLVVKRRRDRLAAAQIWFAGGEHRDYLILHRPPLWNRHAKTLRPGFRRSWSLADVLEPGDIDLRDPADAAKLAPGLEVLDLAALDVME
jgi:DNA invertase Pin-like site-specific DNA recombinase